jgi:LIM domain-containing protein/protein DA1
LTCRRAGDSVFLKRRYCALLNMPRFLLTLALLLLLIAPISTAQAPARRCAACDQVILDEYLSVEGRYFHPDHFQCAYCGKRIDELYVTRNNAFYHGDCYQKRFVVTCHVCNKVVLDEYVEDYWGNFAHAAHRKETPSCDFCKRFIAGGFAAHAVTLPDGRRLCGICAATSVTTPAKAEELARMVSSSLDARGVRVQTDEISFLLLGKDKMRKMSPDPEGHALGFTDFQTTPTKDSGHVSYCNIGVLNGMPEIQMAATLAHEIMHVFLFKAGVRPVSTPWLEGSCEYASYLVMGDMETKESQFIRHNIEANTDSIYGGGFRQVKQFVEKNGVDGWLDALRPPPPPAGE